MVEVQRKNIQFNYSLKSLKRVEIDYNEISEVEKRHLKKVNGFIKTYSELDYDEVKIGQSNMDKDNQPYYTYRVIKPLLFERKKYIKIYEDAGYEYIGKCGRLTYFRKLAEDKNSNSGSDEIQDDKKKDNPSDLWIRKVFLYEIFCFIFLAILAILPTLNEKFDHFIVNEFKDNNLFILFRLEEEYYENILIAILIYIFTNFLYIMKHYIINKEYVYSKIKTSMFNIAIFAGIIINIVSLMRAHHFYCVYWGLYAYWDNDVYYSYKLDSMENLFYMEFRVIENDLVVKKDGKRIYDEDYIIVSYSEIVDNNTNEVIAKNEDAYIDNDFESYLDYSIKIDKELSNLKNLSINIYMKVYDMQGNELEFAGYMLQDCKKYNINERGDDKKIIFDKNHRLIGDKSSISMNSDTWENLFELLSKDTNKVDSVYNPYDIDILKELVLFKEPNLIADRINVKPQKASIQRNLSEEIYPYVDYSHWLYVKSEDGTRGWMFVETEIEDRYNYYNVSSDTNIEHPFNLLFNGYIDECFSSEEYESLYICLGYEFVADDESGTTGKWRYRKQKEN